MLLPMDIAAIVQALDEEIATLQQVKSLLSAAVTAPITERRAQQAAAQPKPARATGKAGKRTMSAEGRARIAAAQKKRWAVKNGEDAGGVPAPAKPAATKSARGQAEAPKAADAANE